MMVVMGLGGRSLIAKAWNVLLYGFLNMLRIDYATIILVFRVSWY